jgi:hypothetical protein
VSWGSVHSISRSSRIPSWKGSPAVWATRSLTTIGTPRKGPSAESAASAVSNSGWITAFSSPFIASTRSTAASTSSRGETSPVRTNSACAVASRWAVHAGASLPVQT